MARRGRGVCISHPCILISMADVDNTCTSIFHERNDSRVTALAPFSNRSSRPRLTERSLRRRGQLGPLRASPEAMPRLVVATATLMQLRANTTRADWVVNEFFGPLPGSIAALGALMKSLPRDRQPHPTRRRRNRPARSAITSQKNADAHSDCTFSAAPIAPASCRPRLVPAADVMPSLSLTKASKAQSTSASQEAADVADTSPAS